MNFKKIIKSFILLTLVLGNVGIVNIHATSDTNSSASTIVSGEGDSNVNTPADVETIDVNWCSGERYATGYAVNQGYYANPISVDNSIESPYKAYVADKCYASFSAAYNRVNSLSGSESRVPVVIDTQTDRIAYATYGFVYLNNSSSSATFSIHVAANSEAKKTYVNATSQRDAVLLDINASGEWAKVMISGVVGYLKLTNSSGTYIHQIIPIPFLDLTTPVYDNVDFHGYRLTRYGASVQDSTAMFLDVLRGTNNSYLVNSGYADKLSFMRTRKVYYSYDGHYFYDDLVKMIDDYRDERYTNALNSTPFYNYYQYLPARAKTNMSASDFNAYLLLNRPTAGDTVTYCYTSSGSTTTCNGSYAYRYNGPSSILYNNGSAFLQGQTNYGINAALIYVKATLEGAYGMSTIARAKYNPFGVNAVDSAPFSSATKYDTVYAGIEAQFKNLMSLGYANPYDSGGRYNGSHVGDKESGCNTMYASDPNWGFKLASLYRALDKMSGYKDLNYYQLGVTIVNNALVYEKASGNSVKQIMENYETKNSYEFDSIDMPVIIVGKENNRYKIVMDAPSDQTTGYYFANDSDYGYVNVSDIYLINSTKYNDPADVGDKISDTTGNVETFSTPIVVNTNGSTKIYDSYRTDITSSFTSVSANKRFVAVRTLTSSGTKYYEIITDYARNPYRTMWVKASDVSVDSSAKLVFTQASSLNCRSSASTNSSSLGLIAMERAPIIYESSTSGTTVNGNTTWYRVLYSPISGTYGYISGAYAAIANSGNDSSGGESGSVSTATKNVVRSIFFNANPFFFGTGVVEGVNVPTDLDMKYHLLISDGTNEYTYPLSTTTTLESLTNSTTYNPGNKYNYDFAWYEGDVNFTQVINSENKRVALPSGNYTLSIKAVSSDNTSTFPLVNANKLALSGAITINDKMNYTITQNKSYELGLTIVNNGYVNNSGDIDLTDYVTLDNVLPAYENSRATSIVATNTSITINGYAFVKDRSITKDSDLWREIIFINEDNNSKEFAYRYNVKTSTSSSHNGRFLTNNKTLNPTGKYNYLGATYTVSLNYNNVLNYTDRSATSMAPGSYRVYVRVSDGKQSTVFPLKDIVLSNGETLNLPSNMQLVDETTRELRLIIN